MPACSCFIRANKELDSSATGYCIELDGRHGQLNRQFHLFAASQVEREECVSVLRKYAVHNERRPPARWACSWIDRGR